MMKRILMCGAAFAALPALAQTGGSTANTSVGGSTAPTSAATGNVANSMSTTTSDHSMHGDNVAGTTSTGTYSQVNGGVTTSSTGTTGTSASTDVDASTPSAGDMSTTSSTAASQPLDGTMAAETDAGATADASTTSSASTDPAMSTMSASTPTAQVAYNGQPASWNFSGDMGTIGTADFGVNRSASAAATTSSGANTGVGGPVDIDGQWSTFAGTEANLTPLQFGTWMLEANGQDVDTKVASTLRSRSANLPAVQVLNVTAGAFAAADADNDHRVSRAELQSFAGV